MVRDSTDALGSTTSTITSVLRDPIRGGTAAMNAIIASIARIMGGEPPPDGTYGGGLRGATSIMRLQEMQMRGRWPR